MKRNGKIIALTLAASLVVGCGSESMKTASATSGGASPSGTWFAPKTVTLPAGTVIAVRLESALSTESNSSGEHFRATLATPVSKDGKVVLPAGTGMKGVVASADKGGRVKGTASMSLRLTGVEVKSKTVDLETSAVTFSARTQHGKDAATVGIGSGLGAAIGAIAGGGKGAAIGAIAGAGAGTGVVLGTRGEQVQIAPETNMSFTLQQPVTVPVS